MRARALRRTQCCTLTDAVTYVMHMENPSPSQSPPRPPHHSRLLPQANPRPGSLFPRRPSHSGQLRAGARPGGPGSQARVPETRRAWRLLQPFIRQRPSGGTAAAAREAAALIADIGQWKFSRQPAALATRPPPLWFWGTGWGTEPLIAEQKSHCTLTPGCRSLPSSRRRWRWPGLPRPAQALGPGPDTQAPHSPPGELCRSLPSLQLLLPPPGLPRAPPQREIQHGKQGSSSDKEKVLHFGRDQVLWGEVQGRSPLAAAPTPISPLSPTPSEVGSGEGMDLTRRFPLLARFQFSLQPQSLAFSKGGGGSPR